MAELIMNEEKFYVDLQVIHIMRQTIETWQEGCEVLIRDMQHRIKSLEENLETIYKILSAVQNSVEKKSDPHVCPNCQGNKLSCFKDNYLKAHVHTLDCKCIICEGKGIIWK